MSAKAVNIIAGVAFVAVSAGLIYGGFKLTGGPAAFETARRDENRIEDVQRAGGEIARRFKDHWRETKVKVLPESLESSFLRSDLSKFCDPYSKKPYAYRRISDNRFELKAELEMTPNQLKRYSWFDVEERTNLDSKTQAWEFPIE